MSATPPCDEPLAPPLRDAQGRVMSYLRLSLTDRCNFRCVYCSPASWGGRGHLLDEGQLGRLVDVFARLGIRRVRLTGGEPLFRADIVPIVRRLAAIPGIGEVCATTNGHQLAALAVLLREAGLRAVNVSLDTLDPERFRTLSGGRGEVARVLEGIEAATGVDVKHVVVRNQRSRWGSCSSTGTISLNWRLVQTPDFVRDYIIYHELMHLREMNHSARFWARVEEVCPGWREAEHWLKRNGSLLGL